MTGQSIGWKFELPEMLLDTTFSVFDVCYAKKSWNNSSYSPVQLPGPKGTTWSLKPTFLATSGVSKKH